MAEFAKSKKGRIAVGFGIFVVLAAVSVFLIVLNGKKGYRDISVSEIVGSVIVGNNGNEYEAYEGLHLADGYSLTTKKESYTRLELDEDKYVKLEEESRAVFTKLGSARNKNSKIDLEYGALTTEISRPLKKNEGHVINTPNAVLAVRGTYYRTVVTVGEDGVEYTDIYTYGGCVAVNRIMPDGKSVKEEVLVNAGYKARIRMDEETTVYIEEYKDGDGDSDNVDPIDPSEIPDDILVEMYDASRHGHGMFLTDEELWDAIGERGIDLSNYKSVYDGSEIEELEEEEEVECEHIPVTEETAATCTKNGVIKVTCSECGEVLSEEVIPATGHTEVAGEALAATCSKTGHTAGKTCSVCGEVLEEQTVIPVTAHKPVAGTVLAATCTKPGHTAGTVCSDCGMVIEAQEEIPATGHKPVSEGAKAATCTDAGHTGGVSCSVCGVTLGGRSTIPATGHTMNTDTLTENYAATCTEAGIMVGTCTTCHQTVQKVIPATGHDIGEEIRTATCTEDGEILYFCKNAGCNYNERETISALGGAHEWETRVTSESTCSALGSAVRLCTKCGKQEGPLAVEKKEHTAVAGEAKAATCTMAGHTAGAKCSVCGEVLEAQETIPATGHDMEEKITKQANCTEEGSKYSKCKNCGYQTAEETIPINEIAHVTYLVNTATCTESGVKYMKCEKCGQDMPGSSQSEPLGHNFENKKCTRCGVSES